MLPKSALLRKRYEKTRRSSSLRKVIERDGGRRQRHQETAAVSEAVVVVAVVVVIVVFLVVYIVLVMIGSRAVKPVLSVVSWFQRPPDLFVVSINDEPFSLVRSCRSCSCVLRFQGNSPSTRRIGPKRSHGRRQRLVAVDGIMNLFLVWRSRARRSRVVLFRAGLRNEVLRLS
jgi:hypothetical protein